MKIKLIPERQGRTWPKLQGTEQRTENNAEFTQDGENDSRVFDPKLCMIIILFVIFSVTCIVVSLIDIKHKQSINKY